MKRILVFSKEPSVSADVESMLKGSFGVKAVADLNGAVEQLKRAQPDITLIDGECEGINGLESFRTLKSVFPRIKPVMISKKGSIDEAVAAAKSGVLDIISKPLQKEVLLASLEKIVSRTDLRGRVPSPPECGEWLKGTSRQLAELFLKAEEASQSEQDIVLSGGPGVPKASFARMIHDNSQNKRKKFVELKMSSFEKEASESMFWTAINELLADHPVDTRSEKEASGTVYLDGFDSLPAHFIRSITDFLADRRQGKSDRTIKIILGLGGIKEVAGNLLRIDLPGLEERREDIPDIASALIDRFNVKYGKGVKGISFKALEILLDHSWPGNYDELEAVLEGAVLRSGQEMIDLKDLPADASMAVSSGIKKALAREDRDLAEARTCFQKYLIETVLACAAFDRDAASRILDIPKTGLAESIKKLGIAC